MSDLLTTDEHKAMDLTTELMQVFVKIVGDGDTRNADMMEMVQHVHGIQNMILAQAAARAYPETYRLLGGTI